MASSKVPFTALVRLRWVVVFFEHNAACPVVAIAKTEDWAKRPFMDGHYLAVSCPLIPDPSLIGFGTIRVYTGFKRFRTKEGTVDKS